MYCKSPIYSNITHTVSLDGQDIYGFKMATKLQGKFIKGLFIRMQNSEGNKYSRHGNPLAGDSIINRAFLSTKYNGTDQVEHYPLEHFGFDARVHSPGDYTPLKFPKGFDLESSYIKISGSAAVPSGTDIEIVFITSPNDKCPTD